MPRAPPPCSRKTTHRRHTHEYTAYACMYLVSCICDVYIRLSRSLWLRIQSFVCRYDESARTPLWVCWPVVLDVDGWRKHSTNYYEFLKAWNMWLKWQQRDGCFCSLSHTDIHTKNGIVWTAARHRGWVSAVYSGGKIQINCWRLALRTRYERRLNNKNEGTKNRQKW